MSIDGQDYFIVSSYDIEKILRKVDYSRIDNLLKKSFLRYIKILNYFLKNPNNIAYDYCKDCKCETDALKRKAYNNIDILYENGFLEISNVNLKRKSKSTHARPFKLSLMGISYLLLNTLGISNHIVLIRNIQKNYKDNLIFELFLYSVISEKSIDEIKYDSSFYTFIIEYLKDMCKDLIVAIRWLNNITVTNSLSTDGFLMTLVFVWPKYFINKDTEDISEKIRFFLTQSLKWEDVESLKIETKISEKMIEIIDASNPSRNAEITILENEMKATLRKNGKLLHEFSITSINGYLHILTNSNIKAINHVAHSFSEKYAEHLVEFLSNLNFKMIRSTSLFHNPTYETLSTDRKYIDAINILLEED